MSLDDALEWLDGLCDSIAVTKALHIVYVGSGYSPETLWKGWLERAKLS